MNYSELLTIDELADALKMKKSTLYTYRQDGLPCKIERPLRFDFNEVVAWMNRKNPNANSQVMGVNEETAGLWMIQKKNCKHFVIGTQKQILGHPHHLDKGDKLLPIYLGAERFDHHEYMTLTDLAMFISRYCPEAFDRIEAEIELDRSTGGERWKGDM